MLGPTDVLYAVMPLFHVHGLLSVLSTLFSGGLVALPSSSRSECQKNFLLVCVSRYSFFISGSGFQLDLFWHDVAACRATWFTAVPTMHQVLNSTPLVFKSSS